MYYKFYEGITKPMPKDYEGTPNELFWSAEKEFAETGKAGTELELQSWVCAFVAKWKPYNYGVYLLDYLEDSPHLDELRKIYEF